MTLFTWNHACAVGVQAMDDQHAILMDMLNELRMALVRGSDRESVAALLGRLIDFTRMHFSCEEQLLEQHQFPGLAKHCLEHEDLLKRIRELTLQVQKSEDLQVRMLLSFLHEWFVKHVEDIDQEYGPWLNQRGVS